MRYKSLIISILLPVLVFPSYKLKGLGVLKGERPVVVFDFDGTLASTMELAVKCYNKIAKQKKLPSMGEKEVEMLRALGVRAMFKKLNVSILTLPFLVKNVLSEMKNERNNIKPIEEAIEAVKILKEEGYKIGIITSNSQDNVQAFVENNKLDLFDFYVCESSIFGKSPVINNFLKTHGLGCKDMIYVGDEVRDIEAAKKSGVKIVAVCWGFSSKELLKKHHPDFTVNTKDELIEAISSLTSIVDSKNQMGVSI